VTQEVQGLPSRRVWELARIPPSTLNYWVQIKLIRPAYRGPEGRRVEQWWSAEDVVVVRALRALRQAGVSVPKLRRLRKTLEASGHDFGSARLVWTGSDIIVQGNDGEWWSGLDYPGQQMLQLAVLPIADWYEQARAEAQAIDLAAFRRRRAKRRRRHADRLERPAALLGST
jgi:DNA-binding transcriptional MerR regulator